MRNPPAARMPALFVSAGLLGLPFVVASLGGCESGGGRKQIDAGYQSLADRQYDQAIGQADGYLQSNPRGRATAEALYLRGRAYEQRVTDAGTKSTPDDARTNLQAARNAYTEALAAEPTPMLDAYIRTSLANVAYFQDDYQTALEQWTTAFDRLDNTGDTKAWTLYRIGLCHQRLGRFDQADKTFAQVQSDFPQTLPAQRAKEHQGQSGFYVQLATFSSPAGADRATAALRREGVLPVRLADPQGRQLLRVGPVQTYAQALQLRSRFTATYPDALIVP
jgi:tetratricopeptide (TPR) repeat protein